MLSVHQHWDPLKICAVGRSYPPEFYGYISNNRVRSVMERIAIETEEDFQKLIAVLESFNVRCIRPELSNSIEDYRNGNRYNPPPMNPRDDAAMIGKKFYVASWMKDIANFVASYGNEIIYDANVNSATNTRVGRDLYIGTMPFEWCWDYKWGWGREPGWPKQAPHKAENVPVAMQRRFLKNLTDNIIRQFPDYRCHVVDTQGHADGTFCPVVPGLIISLNDIPTYAETFPGWEVVYLPAQSWSLVRPFLDLKSKNGGKWWVPGEELNDEFTDYVNQWLDHWVGYVEETVFDVNMLVIDQKNVIVNNYNKDVFAAFDRYGITPHIVNLRHRYFWDGGIHCVTLDLDREGEQKDYFPERGNP